MSPSTRLRLLALIGLVLTAPLAAEPLTDGERQRLVDELAKSRHLFQESVDGLSDAQWNYKPAEDRWSIAECAEHVTLVEEFILGNVEKLLAGPAGEGLEAPREEEIVTVMLDRSKKFKAPEPVAPKRSFESKKQTLKTWKQGRKAVDKVAKNASDLRSYVAPHPAFGDIDAYGWLFFLSSHTQRHTAQIEEVKEAPAYPGK